MSQRFVRFYESTMYPVHSLFNERLIESRIEFIFNHRSIALIFTKGDYKMIYIIYKRLNGPTVNRVSVLYE